MKRPMRQVLAGSLMAGLALVTCGISTAQVGPSSENIRRRPKPRPKVVQRKPKPAPAVRVKPVETVRVRTLPRKPVAATPAPAKPVAAAPAVSPQLKAAQKWQSDELKALEVAARAGAGLTAPKLGSVRAPVAPTPPPKPEPELVYVQRVSLKVAREDGAAVDSRLIQRAGEALQVRYDKGAIELEGPRFKQGDPDTALQLPADWAFVDAQDARLSLQTFPGTETRTELAARVEQKPRELPVPAPLFASEQEKQTLRAQNPRLISPPVVSAYPMPGAQGLSAITRLVEARRILDQVIPLPEHATAEQRRQAWLELDRASRLLGEADTGLKMANRAYTQLRASNKARELLKTDYKLKYDNHLAWLAAARLRRLQYLAEAEWWKAECENPVSPDRTTALQILRQAQENNLSSNELAAQAARYGDIAQQEATIQARLKAGEYDRRAVPRIQITHHLTKSVKLRRTVVDVRIPRADLLPTDTLALAASPKQPLTAKLDGDYWRVRVPRSLVKKGDALLLRRRSEASEMEAELRLVQADPYNLDGNAVERGGLRLVAIRGYSIGDTANNIRLFEELEAVDRPNAKLASARKKAAKDGQASADGTWRVEAENGPFVYRMRPSPYLGKRDGGTFEDRVTNFIRRVRGKEEDRSKRLLGPVIVDAIRLEGASAGNVAGVKVGTKAADVEKALGGPVPSNGAVRYLNGGLEIAMRNGEVSYIEIRRQLDDLVNQGAPATRPGEVTEVDYDANRLKVQLGEGFQPIPGNELEVFVAGQELGGGREEYRAVVLDVTGSVATCKLVRKDRGGKITGDADWWVVRSLPPGECAVVMLRPTAVL